MENKELPSEYVSIRQVWLQGINDSRRAIGQQSIHEASLEKNEMVVGAKTVCHTVEALYLSLVDVGEAMVRSDVDKWYDEFYRPKSSEIWGKREVKKEGEINREYQQRKHRSYQQKWWDTARLYEHLYDKIIQVLNKYGMLFPEQPRGYSNVEMKSV